MITRKEIENFKTYLSTLKPNQEDKVTRIFLQATLKPITSKELIKGDVVHAWTSPDSERLAKKIIKDMWQHDIIQPVSSGGYRSNLKLFVDVVMSFYDTQLAALELFNPKFLRPLQNKVQLDRDVKKTLKTIKNNPIVAKIVNQYLLMDDKLEFYPTLSMFSMQIYHEAHGIETNPSKDALNILGRK